MSVETEIYLIIVHKVSGLYYLKKIYIIGTLSKQAKVDHTKIECKNKDSFLFSINYTQM